MQQRPFGELGAVSALTLGGRGIGQVWGPTTRQEWQPSARPSTPASASWTSHRPTGTVKLRRSIGDAFDGGLPSHVRVTTKCRVRQCPSGPDLRPSSRKASTASLQHMKLDHADVMFLHNWLHSKARRRRARRPPRSSPRPSRRRLSASLPRGASRYWGLTGIGEPEAIIRLLNYGPRPSYVQCIANLLDSAGGLRRFTGPARPREIIAAANANSVAVMGIRAVQAGALTSAFDRPLPADHPDTADYDRAAPFREIAAELGDSPAYLAHRYALSVPGVSDGGPWRKGPSRTPRMHRCRGRGPARPLPHPAHRRSCLPRLGLLR